MAPWILYCDLEKFLKNDLFQDSYAPAGKPLKYVKLDFSKDKNTLLVNGPQVFDSYIGKNFLKNKNNMGTIFMILVIFLVNLKTTIFVKVELIINLNASDTD